jgi:hypothetical protein
MMGGGMGGGMGGMGNMGGMNGMGAMGGMAGMMPGGFDPQAMAMMYQRMMMMSECRDFKMAHIGDRAYRLILSVDMMGGMNPMMMNQSESS